MYQLVNKVLCLQFCDVFFIHLSSHLFSVAMKGGARWWFMVFELF